MPKPFNILRTITWLPSGGIENKILAVLPRLDPQRFRPRVLCLRELGPVAEKLAEAGVPVDLIPFRSRLDPIGIWRFCRYIKRHKIDLIHAHMYRASIPSTIAGTLCGARIVSQIHNVGTWESRRQIWMDRRLASRRSAMIAVSERVRQDAIQTLGIAPEFARLIYNGVDLSHFAPPEDRAKAKKAAGFSPDDTVVLMAARLVEQKNPFGFIELAAKLLPRHPEALFAMAGAGPLEGRIREQAKAAGLGERFRVLGLCDPIIPVYQAADLFVLPSFKEGFSNALAEAMACGLPVVATDVGGAPEAILDGESGFLIPPADVQRLEESVERLLSDPQLRLSMSKAARERAGRFSLDRMIDDVQALYSEVLS